MCHPSSKPLSGSTPKQKIPATVKNAVWCTYMGDTTERGKCYCCGVESISKGNFATGHVVAEARGGAVTLQNLRPVCTLCNSSMGKTDMHTFMARHGFSFRGIPIAGSEGVPYFEQLKKACIIQ
jgi:hypothetical protein